MTRKSVLIVILGFTLLLSACQPSGAPFFTPTIIISRSSDQSSIPSPNTSTALTETTAYTPSITSIPTATRTINPAPVAMPNMRVAYLDSSELWIQAPPGSPELVAEDIDTERIKEIFLSDDGSAIVLRYDNFGSGDDWRKQPVVATISPGISGVRSMLTLGHILELEKPIREGTPVLYNLAWIPGSHQLFLTTRNFSASYRDNFPHNNLIILDLDIGSVSRIFKAGDGGTPTPAPNGKSVVVSRYGSVFLSSNSGKTIIPNFIPKDYEPASMWGSTNIVWKPDSSRFGAVVPSADGKATLWSVDTVAVLSSTVGTIPDFYDGVLSPTLEFVGYTTESGGYSVNATISRMNGTEPILLASGRSWFDSFSPDGRYFIYYVGCGYPNDCSDSSKDKGFFLGSVDGVSFPISGRSLKWINNSQFVYISNKSLRLGDIGGNYTELVHLDFLLSFDAKDLDFQGGIP